MKNRNKIMVYLEYRDGIVHPVGLQLLHLAHQLVGNSNWDIIGVLIGPWPEKAKQQLLGYALNEIYLCAMPDNAFSADSYSQVLCHCIERCNPSVVLIGGTDHGRSIAPRAAVYFKSGLTADCIELSIRDDDALVQVRPAFGGNIMARILTPNTRPQFATVRPGIFPQAEQIPNADTSFTNMVAHSASPLEVVERTIIKQQTGIAEASVLVAVGKGVQNKSDLAVLESLALSLGGKLACSRGIVERGWLPQSMQIGLSGQAVAPKLLLTVGISGSVQFLSGIRRSGTIVSVNIDPTAGIFEVAHHPVCGDWQEIIPGIATRIQKQIHPC